MPHAGWGVVRFVSALTCGHVGDHYALGLCRKCYRNSPEFKAKRRQYYEANKARWAEHAAKSRARRVRQTKAYGISRDAYDAMLRYQLGLCAICRQLPGRKGLGVDHDHATGKVRALLCAKCNLALGALRDNADLCREAAKYLDYHHSLYAASVAAGTTPTT